MYHVLPDVLQLPWLKIMSKKTTINNSSTPSSSRTNITVIYMSKSFVCPFCIRVRTSVCVVWLCACVCSYIHMAKHIRVFSSVQSKFTCPSPTHPWLKPDELSSRSQTKNTCTPISVRNLEGSNAATTITTCGPLGHAGAALLAQHGICEYDPNQ